MIRETETWGWGRRMNRERGRIDREAGRQKTEGRGRDGKRGRGKTSEDRVREEK
jgi:hypothetical protein